MRLFPPHGPPGEIEEVQREVAVLSGTRRADLVVLWSGQRASHVEVKIWDQNFDKTAETGRGCRELFGTDRAGWRDYLLVPDESLEALDGFSTADVSVVTWTDVARELRRELLHGGSSAQWTSFASAFCGAIEQTIMGVPRFSASGAMTTSSAAVFRVGRILREASGG
jgi:hypothetical protein